MAIFDPSMTMDLNCGSAEVLIGCWFQEDRASSPAFPNFTNSASIRSYELEFSRK